ncbi:MAG: hypothetical protein HGA22_12595 [Clostridiales bacterium]|nr:hypothetical protein [Clostridiales bacterium]
MLGGKLETENDSSFETAEGIIEAIGQFDIKEENKLLPLLDYIDVSDTASVVLSLDSRITVRIGGMDDLNYRISSLKTIFFKNIKENETGLLDFTTGEDPVFSPGSGR